MKKHKNDVEVKLVTGITKDNAGVKYLQGRLSFVEDHFHRTVGRIEKYNWIDNPQKVDEVAILMSYVIEVREHEMALEVLGYAPE